MRPGDERLQYWKDRYINCPDIDILSQKTALILVCIGFVILLAGSLWDGDPFGALYYFFFWLIIPSSLRFLAAWKIFRETSGNENDHEANAFALFKVIGYGLLCVTFGYAGIKVLDLMPYY